MGGLTTQILGQSVQQVGLTILAVVVIALGLQFVFYGVLSKGFDTRHSLPYTLLVPAIVGLSLLVIFPILYNFFLAFTDMSLRRFGFDRGMTMGIAQGLNNFRDVFTSPVLQQQHFFPVFGRTVLWTAMQVTVHVTFGMGLAILLNRPMKMRGVYRAIILIPWAIPQIVAVLTWRTEFNAQWGFVNIMLQGIGLEAIPWMTSRFWNFMAFNIVNFWLGIPFMTVILLGGLQSINDAYYESAEIDGASKWQRFTNVTIPMIKPVLTPAVILGVIWTFNNFNIPYFINQRGLETSDILVTALFRAAFEFNRYGFAAAFAIVIFVILLGFTIAYMKITGFNPTIKANNAPVPAGSRRKK